MKQYIFPLSFLVAVPLLTHHAFAQDGAVDPYFADHMVLQQGKENSITGDAPQGTPITVTLAGQKASATANAQGRWRVRLNPIQGGVNGPMEIKIGTQSFTIKDVVLGDVWLCSGQSNMDWPLVNSSSDVELEQEAKNTTLRIARVARHIATQEADRVIMDKTWSLATAQSIEDFSAACWHMGKNLEKAGKGPIGLVQSSWGGTNIEQWMSVDAVQKVPGNAANLDILAAYVQSKEQGQDRLINAVNDWADKVDLGSNDNAPWYATDLDDSHWPQVTLPHAVWQRFEEGSPLADDAGIVWFRHNVRISGVKPQSSATLNLGKIDVQASIWVNGQFIGHSATRNDESLYDIPFSLLKNGDNQIAVRAIVNRWQGGVRAKAADFKLAVNGHDYNLAGKWRYKMGATRSAMGRPPIAPWQAAGGTSILWNGMIAPLAVLGFKGLVWYQGEANANYPNDYEKLLSAYITDYRSKFQQDMPMIVAQLPLFDRLSDRPTQSDWAVLRDQQRRFATNDDNIGLAVLMDLGVRNNIHPAHKDEVGKRLADEALRLAYGDISQSGPMMPVKALRDGDNISISFQSAQGEKEAMKVMSGHDIIAFELCRNEEDCAFASARLSADRQQVVISGAKPDHVFIRYGWAQAPIMNLYDRNDIPVTPFHIMIE